MNLSINIRASYLSSYFDCPRRAAVKIIPELLRNAGFEPRQRAPIVSAAIGIAVHHGEYTVMDSKLKIGVACSEGNTVDSAISEFDEMAKEELTYDSMVPDKNTGEKQVIRITKSYYNMVQPNIKPKRIWNPESKQDMLKANVSDGFFLTGHPDLLMEGDIVDDTKTGVVMRSPHGQLGAYSLLLRSNEDQCKGLQSVFLKRTTLKKPQPDPVIQMYSQDMCELVAWSTINKIKSHVQEFAETGKPEAFPANPMSMLCDKAKWCYACDKWCPFGRK